MSGSISQPMVPQQGAAPGGLPPQLLAMLMAAAQRQQGGPAQAQMQGPAQPQMGGPAQSPMPQPPQQMPPQMQQAMQMPSQQQIPAPVPGGMSNSFGGGAPMASRMAQMGRHGDTMMAHMTPGEIAVPPQVQTPGVLSALQQAFKSAGADVRQFAAGSPFAAHNPDTGQQEFSLWSAILPVLGAVGGGIIGGPVGAAAGGALGGGAGGAIDHTGATGILLGAAGGGLGGYLGGGGASSLLGSSTGAAGNAAATGAAGSLGNAAATGAATNAAGGAAGSAATNAPFGAPSGAAAQSAMAARMAAGDSPAMVSAGALPQAAPMGASPSLMSMAKTGMSAGMGASIGQSLAPPPSSNTPAPLGPSMGPVNPNAMIGGRPAVSAPNFSGYSPYASVTSPTGPYQFYP